jgi:hypothetical protein
MDEAQLDRVIAALQGRVTVLEAQRDDLRPLSLLQWLSEDGTVDTTWLGARMGQAVASAGIRDQQKIGGMSCECKYIDVVLASGSKVALVMKTSGENAIGANRVTMGCAREAFFYNELASKLTEANVPKTYYAHGDMKTGATTLVMECLEDAVPAGCFFGAGNPNNWGVKDRLEAMCDGNPTGAETGAAQFSLYARMHGTYWKDDSLLSNQWLRASDWYQGQGEASWKASQAMAAGAWANCKKAIAAGTSPVKWDEHVIACLDASFGRVDWGAFQAEIKTRPHCLVMYCDWRW